MKVGTAPTASELHRLGSQIFGRPFGLSEARLLLTELGNKPRIKQLFLLAAEKLLSDNRGRSCQDHPLIELARFCADQQQKGEPDRTALAEALKERFPVTGPAHQPTGAPAEYNPLKQKVIGLVLKDVPGSNQTALELLDRFGLDLRSFLFAQRVLSGEEMTFLEKMFGESLQLTDVKEVSERHFHLKLQLSPGALLGVVQPWDLKVGVKCDHVAYQDGAIANRTNDFSFFAGLEAGGREIGDEIDRFGTDLTIAQLESGEAVLDCTKIVTWTGERTGKKYRLVYKPFDPVRLEHRVNALLDAIKLPTYKINIRKDQWGHFGWIEYVANKTFRESNLATVLTEKNINLLGQHIGWSYIFGYGDLNEENLFFRNRSRTLVRFDFETAFPPVFYGGMMTYLDRVLQDMSDGCHFPPGFSDLIKDKLQLMMTGVAIVIKRFRDRELKETWTNLLVKEILEPMIEEGIRNRFLLQSTTGYWNGNDAYPLQGVVPYYSLPLDMFSSIALLERINGLETKEK